MKKEIWKRDGVAQEATSEIGDRARTRGYRGGKPAGESERLMEDVLIEGKGVTAHIRKIRRKSPLVRQAGGRNGA